jgi:hypothetical protein
MKSFLIIFGFILFNLNIHSQCNCNPLPIPTKAITVKNVTELQNALAQANANNGDLTILVSKGTYILNSNLLYIGSNMKNLTIQGATGNRDDVVIKGQGMNGSVTHIFNVAASHFTLADMTIGWVFYHPIQIHGESNADSTLIHNVKIIDGNEQFIKISGSSTEPYTSDGGIIECCHFEFSAGVGNQYYTGGVDGHHCTNWVVRKNIFKHLRSPDGNLAEHAIHFWSNSKDIIAENNQIINCDRGIGYGLGDDPARGNFGGIIRNNFVHTSRDVGIGIERTPDVKIYNNTVWTDNYFNSIEYRFTGTKNAHIVNNLTNKSIALREGAQGLLENNYTQAITSMFVNAANYDYHLSKNDPNLIGKGKVLNEVHIDFDCISRGQTNDIGGDQYVIVTNSESSTNSKNLILVYPNPANQFISFNIQEKEEFEFKLFSFSGNLVLHKIINEIFNPLNLIGIESGIYFYEISNGIKMSKRDKLVIIK